MKNEELPCGMLAWHSQIHNAAKFIMQLNSSFFILHFQTCNYE